MSFLITLVLIFVAIWIFQGSKGVNYLFTLKRILKDEYGWTQSECDAMWADNMQALNQLKVEGQSTRQIAQHIDQYLSQYKSAFK
jgi:hypothetical protein|tara:strand:- start:2103 stop:2357 length:255 start_codon:yes stop_codon:yes gene_type:complete